MEKLSGYFYIHEALEESKRGYNQDRIEKKKERKGKNEKKGRECQPLKLTSDILSISRGIFK